MKTCVIGIDVGTSGCKTIAISPDGSILGESLREYPLYQPQPGYSEQEPEDWWQGAVGSIRELIEQIGPAEIAGVSFSGQMHGMVALDRQGKVVRRAILWNDQRTEKQCSEITSAAGGLDGLLGYTNNRMLTGFTGGKILWMKEHEPENYQSSAVVINPKDYLRYRLTGEIATDVSDASGTGFFDVQHRRWARDLIEQSGLRYDLFPPVVESTGRTGSVSAQAAELTGIPEGTPVYGGGGDAVISTAGMGLVLPGRVGITLGTSGVVACTLSEYAPNPEGKLQFFCANSPGKYVAFGCTLAAAGSYQWFRDALESADSFRALDDAAQQTPPGAEGLLFLPYLTGERCPVFDASARGAFVGIHARMGKGHFARAVLEGVCYSMKQVYDGILTAAPGIQSDTVVVAGGGAKSPLWRQMLADIFGLPVSTVYGSAQGGAFGAALVAGAGCGMYSSLEDAMRLSRRESETLPQQENREIYREGFEKYVRLYDALKWSFI